MYTNSLRLDALGADLSEYFVAALVMLNLKVEKR